MTDEHQPTIVITGAGLVTALGLNKSDAWRRVAAGESGVRPLVALEQIPVPNKGGAEAPLSKDDNANAEPREVTILKMAVHEAIAEARLDGHWPAAERCGALMGTTLAGMRSGGQFLRTNDATHMRQFQASSTLQSAFVDLPCNGPAMTTCSACASGLSSIALAVTLLQNGFIDLAIAGGYDAMSEYAYAGFNSLRLVSDEPIMPFSTNRNGMKLGEGAGIVILERAADALKRGAKPLATIAGSGESSDAHHLTQPHPEGDGAARAITAALRAARLNPNDIDLICAHATATPANDAAEFAAYQRVFGDNINRIPVVAFKSHVGHTLGGAGAVELVLALLARENKCVPPIAGIKQEDVEFPSLNVVTGAAIPHDINHTMNVSMGFGGANACVILGPAPSKNTAIQSIETAPRTSQQGVVITGVGVVLPNCIGNDALIERLRNANADVDFTHTGPIDESAYDHLVNARRARRISAFAKMMLAATTAACRDANLEELLTGEVPCSAILGSTHGAAEYSESYYRQVVADGIDAANPMLFAEGVPNVASAQLSLMLNLRGSAQTLIGSRTAALDALMLATQRIRAGVWERAIVGAAEEFSEIVNRIYRQCVGKVDGPVAHAPSANHLQFGCGAVVLLLESERAARDRSAHLHARIESCGSARCLSTKGNRTSAEMFAEQVARLLHDHSIDGGLMGSSNGTWVDAIEHAATRSLRKNNGTSVNVASMYKYIGETHSIGPLAGLAGAMLMRRSHGDCRADSRDEYFTSAAERRSALALDSSGVASVVAVRLS